MTEEMKKLIEEEAERYADSKGIYNQHGEALLKMGFKKGANFILSKWQEAERWRKFGTDDLPKIGMRILLRVGERHDTTVICSHSHIHSISEVFTEWKPIS